MASWVFSSVIVSALGLIFTLILLIEMLLNITFNESIYRASITTLGVYCGIMIWGSIYHHMLKPAIDHEEDEDATISDEASE